MHRYAETRLFRRQHTAAEGRMPQVTAFAVAEAAVVPAEAAAAVAALAGAVVAVVPPAGYPYGLHLHCRASSACGHRYRSHRSACCRQLKGLNQCRRRIQWAIAGRRGRAGDRLYRARRTLLTGADLLTDAQAERLENLFADERHAAVQASWGVYQRLIQTYRTENPGLGEYLTQRLIDSLRQAVPDGLEETTTLARTLTERTTDSLGLPRQTWLLQRPHAKPSTDAWSTYAVSP